MADNEHEGMKKCTKCGEWKPATAEFFHRDKTAACGLKSMCKECRGYRGREYRKENRDKISERKREYREKNKDKIADSGREYYEKNKEKIAEYYEKNKEKIAEWQREHREKNRDKILKYMREYREKNKEKIAEWKHEYNRSGVGRLSNAVEKIRRKTGATIYLPDMTDEEKETLANQYVAVRTLEKTEKELLAASGKKRCTKCDRVLDYDCFSRKKSGRGGVQSICKDCHLKWARKYRQKKEKST